MVGYFAEIGPRGQNLLYSMLYTKAFKICTLTSFGTTGHKKCHINMVLYLQYLSPMLYPSEQSWMYCCLEFMYSE